MCILQGFKIGMNWSFNKGHLKWELLMFSLRSKVGRLIGNIKEKSLISLFFLELKFNVKEHPKYLKYLDWIKSKQLDWENYYQTITALIQIEAT